MDRDRDTYSDSADDMDNVEEPTDGDKPKRGRGCGCWIALLVVLLLGGAVTGYFMGTIITREETPLPLEPEITDLGLRLVAIPSNYADMRLPSKFVDANNQNSPNANAVAKGKEIFGAECAICHGQDGKGDGPYGITMYPPAADLTHQRTQTKSDGQLYWLIAHGINLTGMPAWGTEYGGANSDDDIWNMVAYIRSLTNK